MEQIIQRITRRLPYIALLVSRQLLDNFQAFH
jgi:hypothetical protein